MNVNKDELVDKVIAFKLDGDVSFGYVFSTEGKEIRVFEYKPISATPAQTQRVLDKVVEEDALITSLQAQLKALRDRYDVESSEAKSGEDYKMEGTLLQWAHERLYSLPAAGWAELVKAPGQWPSTALVCEVVVLISENSVPQRSVPPNRIRALFSKKDLVESLRCLADKPLKESVYQKILDDYLADRLFSLERVTEESKHGAALYKWVTAFIDYQRARFIKGSDKELQIQIDNCVKGIGQSSRRKSLLLEEQELVKNQKVRRRTGYVHVVPIEDFLYVVEGDPSGSNTLTVNDQGAFRPLQTIISSATQSSNVNNSPRYKGTPREGNEEVLLPKEALNLNTTATAAPVAAASTKLSAPPTIPNLPPRRAPLSKYNTHSATSAALSAPKTTLKEDKREEVTLKTEKEGTPASKLSSKVNLQKSEQIEAVPPLPAFTSPQPPPPPPPPSSVPADGTGGDVSVRTATPANDGAPSTSAHTSEMVDADVSALCSHHDAWVLQLNDLRHQLELAQSSQSKLIREHETLRSRYEDVVDAFYLLLEDKESDRNELAVLRSDLSQSRQELLLCKALVKMLRRDNCAASLMTPNPCVSVSPMMSGAGQLAKKNDSSQLLLDETAEYLQGVLASLAVNLS